MGVKENHMICMSQFQITQIHNVTNSYISTIHNVHDLNGLGASVCRSPMCTFVEGCAQRVESIANAHNALRAYISLTKRIRVWIITYTSLRNCASFV